LDHALKALAFARAFDVDGRAVREDVLGTDDLTDLELLELLGIEADLADEALRLRSGFLDLADLGFVRVAHRLLVETEHERGVAIAIDRARADHVARTGLDHGDRHGFAVIREHLGHTDLLAE